MVCYEYIKSRYVQKPFQKVPIVNWKYIYVYCSNICKTKIEKNKNIFSKYNLKIKSTNNNQRFFNVKTKQNKKIIYNLEGKPVSCISDTYNGKKITANEKEEKVIANIIPISKKKYKVEFTNLITNKPDFFEMKTDEQFQICGIYYRKKSEGFSLICKIERDQYGPGTCGIEMAPSVDITILFTLAVFFNDIKDFKKHLNCSNSNYDVIKTHSLINDNKNKYHVFKNMKKDDSDSVFSYISYDNDTETDDESDSDGECDNENYNKNNNESGSNKQFNSSTNILNTCYCDDQTIIENNDNNSFNTNTKNNNDSNNKINKDENNTNLDTINYSHNTINNSNNTIYNPDNNNITNTNKCHKYEYSNYQYSYDYGNNNHDTLNNDSGCYDNYGTNDCSIIDCGFNKSGCDDCGCDDCGCDVCGGDE